MTHSGLPVVRLLPCPFCGDAEPEIERRGTGRVSCIVACTYCGCRLESADEGDSSGASWNRRDAIRVGKS